MDLGLTGKRALITGSSRGIGLAIARSLAAEGCLTTLHGRDEARLAASARSIPSSDWISADLATDDGPARLIDTFIDRHGSLDVLVCNVGDGRSKQGMLEAQDDWMRQLQVNLLVATATCSAAIPRLGVGASIVCISSICGRAALGCPLAYGSAKAALDHYVRGAARHLGARGIRINAVSPGNILFPGSTWEGKQRDKPDEVSAMLAREVPLSRFGTPDEIAACVTFLASSRAAFVTGHIMVVDGGQTRS